MKKLLLIVLAAAAAVSVSACGNSELNESVPEESPSEVAVIDEKNYDIALVTDSKGIEDEENLSVWKSIIAYGDSNSKTYKYYTQTGNGGESPIDEAVDHNAKIIVLSDSDYVNSAAQLGSEYPNVSFLIVDNQPESELPENVHCIKFREEQAGYLAGYLSVMEGYTSVGFLADGKSDRNTRYLYGVVQGADDATQELRIHDVTVKYAFADSGESKAKEAAKKLYKSGAEVIFACGDSVVKGTDEAAKEMKKKMICGEKIYSEFGAEVLTSIEYNKTKAIDYSVRNGFDSELNWLGEDNESALNLGVESGCIDISSDEALWNFQSFNRAYYDELAERFVNGEIDISDKTDAKPPIAAVVYEEVKLTQDSEQ